MRRTGWRRTGRIVVAFVVGAYAVPSAGFIVSGLVHLGSHFTMEMQRQYAKAAALGLVHGPGLPSLVSLASSDASAPDSGEEAFVHSHGGDEHAHDPRIARELRQAEDRTADGDTTYVLASLTAHVPASTRAVTEVPATAPYLLRFEFAESSGVDPPLSPPPPPRA